MAGMRKSWLVILSILATTIESQQDGPAPTEGDSPPPAEGGSPAPPAEGGSSLQAEGGSPPPPADGNPSAPQTPHLLSDGSSPTDGVTSAPAMPAADGTPSPPPSPPPGEDNEQATGGPPGGTASENGGSEQPPPEPGGPPANTPAEEPGQELSPSVESQPDGESGTPPPAQPPVPNQSGGGTMPVNREPAPPQIINPSQPIIPTGPAIGGTNEPMPPSPPNVALPSPNITNVADDRNPQGDYGIYPLAPLSYNGFRYHNTYNGLLPPEEPSVIDQIPQRVVGAYGQSYNVRRFGGVVGVQRVSPVIFNPIRSPWRGKEGRKLRTAAAKLFKRLRKF